MDHPNVFYARLLALAVVLSLGPLAANAQQAVPTDNKGFTTGKSEIVDLGSEIDGMTGRHLRLRVLSIAPGGHIGIHSHKDRPAVVYFIKGTDTVTFKDGTSKTFHAGDTTKSTKDTTHWHQNNGTEDVVLIAADILHKKK